jgi:hypothetical protein
MPSCMASPSSTSMDLPRSAGRNSPLQTLPAVILPDLRSPDMIYSYTQISQYLACPRRYRHRYLDGWRRKTRGQRCSSDAPLNARWGRISCGKIRLLPCFRNGSPVRIRSSNTRMATPGIACSDSIVSEWRASLDTSGFSFFRRRPGDVLRYGTNGSSVLLIRAVHASLKNSNH